MEILGKLTFGPSSISKGPPWRMNSGSNCPSIHQEESTIIQLIVMSKANMNAF
jgi:hypothetical protein